MRKLHRSFQVLFFSVVLLFPLQGCGMFESDLVKEMDAVYENFKKDDQAVIRKEKMSQIVKKYFPVGMPLSDALKYFQDNGFNITEFRQEGSRKLPDGVLRPFHKEADKKGYISEDEVVNYYASKIYDSNLLSITTKGVRFAIYNKEVGVNLYSKDGKMIFESRGSVNFNAL